MESRVTPRAPTGRHGMPRDPTALSHGIPRDAVACQVRSCGSFTRTPRDTQGVTPVIFSMGSHGPLRAAVARHGILRRYVSHDNPRDFSWDPATSHRIPWDARCDIACSEDEIVRAISPRGAPRR